jgi:hypothetical protein
MGSEFALGRCETATGGLIFSAVFPAKATLLDTPFRVIVLRVVGASLCLWRRCTTTNQANILDGMREAMFDHGIIPVDESGKTILSPDEPARIAFCWRVEDKAQALFVALEAYRSRLPETHSLDRLIGTSSELLGSIAVKMVSNPGSSGFSCIGMQGILRKTVLLPELGEKSVTLLFVDCPSCLLPSRVSTHLLEAFHGFARAGHYKDIEPLQNAHADV